MQRFLLALFACFWASTTYAWNNLGHEIIAQIAYDQLSHEAQKSYDRLLSKSYHGSDWSMDKPRRFDRYQSARLPPFVAASTWLDAIKYRHIHRYDALHYCDIPYTEDGSRLYAVPKPNAITAIKEALEVLNTKNAKLASKALNLRILIHVVGDIHQPLHAINRISRSFPEGDLGGNLFPLGANPIAPNLHRYWDLGGGLLNSKSVEDAVRLMASQLERRWSCEKANVKSDPEEWIKNAYDLAVHEAYTLSAGSIPDEDYEANTKAISEQQLFLAGCRLALLLSE